MRTTFGLSAAQTDVPIEGIKNKQTTKNLSMGCNLSFIAKFLHLLFSMDIHPIFHSKLYPFSIFAFLCEKLIKKRILTPPQSRH
jgi:hypothetical protein